jgi:acetyl-CoA C-acetyltransferase
MPKVGIVSSETAKFTKWSDSSIFDLACEPCIHILKNNNNLSKRDVEAVLFSSCSNEQYSSSIISEMLGLKPRISNRIDNLCNSGTNAIISAFSYIVSGLCDSVLVVGAEKANTMGSKLLWDVTRGSFNLPIHWSAIFANAHMRRYGTTEEQMAMVAVKNRTNAKKNPKALFRKIVTISDVMKSRKIIDPLKLLDCSYLCDGASALLLMSEEKTKKFTDSPVWIKGFGQQTSAASLSQVIDRPSIGAAKLAARDAFNMSNINSLSIDVAEVHDAFTILEILAYEDLGFTEEGKGGNFVNQDKIAINTRGGILGCGHAVGATGIAQTTEIVAQLSQKAWGRQVKGCKTGLIHNLAAAGTSATVIILGVD